MNSMMDVREMTSTQKMTSTKVANIKQLLDGDKQLTIKEILVKTCYKSEIMTRHNNDQLNMS